MNTYYTDITTQRIQIEGIFYTHWEIAMIRMNIPTDKQSFRQELFTFLSEWFNHQPTVLVHTSGSTGKPKPMRVEKESMMESACLTCSFLGLKENDTALLCMPLQYIAGKMVVIRSLVAGLNLLPVTPSGHPLKNLKKAPVFAAMIPMQVYNSLQVPEEKELLKQIHAYIESLPYSHEPKGLYDPIEYVLGLGGKRLRPVLMLLAYNLFKEDVQAIFSQATAIETYHNFTLLHDDLMDKADMRRGKPTVHKKWDENTAILSGDAMLILSFQFMMQGCPVEYTHQVMNIFSRTALEVCDGQQWDMEFESREDVTVDEYMEMIRLKTSVLLAGALKIGAVLGGASEKDAQLLYDFGIQIGLAFQLQDDYLDVYGDPLVFGKNIGGDILCNKKTFMLITALEKSDDKTRASLQEWLKAEDYVPAQKIEAVTAIYNKVGLQNICRDKINEYYHEGMRLLKEVNVEEEYKNNLSDFVMSLMERNL